MVVTVVFDDFSEANKFCRYVSTSNVEAARILCAYDPNFPLCALPI